MNSPFFLHDFNHAELAVMAHLMSFGSVQCKNTDAKTPPPPPKTAQVGRVEVVYIGGCFKEAQNIKRWLDVTTGILYHDPDFDRVLNSGFVADGAQNARPIYVNRAGDKVRFMQQTTLDGTVAVTYMVGTTAFISEYVATNHAKHLAILNPGKGFTVDKVTTTKVVTKSKPYKVTEKAQVTTVKTKSWE